MPFLWKRVVLRRRYGMSGRRSRSRFQSKTILFPIPTAGNVYSLTVGSGSYAQTGSNVGLKWGHNTPVGSGSYALTGSSVGLKRGYPITVVSGSYIVTGTSVALRHAWMEAISSGTYSLSGSNVGLKRGYPITVNSGTYTLNGTDVTLKHTWTMPVGNGTYILTGSTVGLKRGYPISVNSGTYTLTGSNVNLKYGHTIPVNSGSYLLSGSSMGLIRGRPVSVGSGSYSLSGSNVVLLDGHKIPVGSGVYNLTGSDVDLRYSSAQPRLSVGAGSYIVSGSGVGLAHGYKNAVGTGSYVLSGANVTLRYGHKIPIGSGSYAYNGSTVGLRRGYPIVVGPGSYNLRSFRTGVANLSACYRFDNDLYDSSGHSLDLGILSGSVTYSTGRVGQAATGSATVGRTNDVLVGDVAGPYTVAGYFKVGAGNLFDPSESTVLVESLRLGLRGDGSVLAGLFDPSSGASVVTSTVAANSWVHVALKMSGGIGSVFIDGTLIGTTPLSGTFNPLGQFQVFLRVGGFGFDQVFVDQLFVYDVAISDSRISQLASGYDPTDTINLLYGHHASITSGSYILTGSSVTLTYSGAFAGGGTVCATVYIIPRVDGIANVFPEIIASVDVIDC